MITYPGFALVDSTAKVVNLVDVPKTVQGTNTFIVPAGQTLVPTNGVEVAIGSAYANGVFTPPAAPTPTLEDNETAVDKQRDSLLATGYFDSKTGKTFQCDSVSRGFLTAVGASAASALMVTPQPNFVLIASDNTTVTLDASDTFALINGRIMPWVSNMIMFGRNLKNLYIAGTPPASIETGWPTT